MRPDELRRVVADSKIVIDRCAVRPNYERDAIIAFAGDKRSTGKGAGKRMGELGRRLLRDREAIPTAYGRPVTSLCRPPPPFPLPASPIWNHRLRHGFANDPEAVVEIIHIRQAVFGFDDAQLNAVFFWMRSCQRC